MNLIPILVFAATALLTPMLGWIAHVAIQAAKNRRAIVILRDEPLAYEGARFSRLLSSAGAPLMGAGRVASMTRTRIECRDDEGSALVFTAREFAAAYPRWTATDEGSGVPPVRPHGRKR